EKQFALKADVTPALGSSLTALSAITGIASPFTALAVYALMKVIPDINEDLISYYYDVTGPWDAPVVKERRNKN
ncbi:AsmA-like C-terminal region-containing protein, partial [Thiomicrorhabdus heinhorstiae]